MKSENVFKEKSKRTDEITGQVEYIVAVSELVPLRVILKIIFSSLVAEVKAFISKFR